MHEHEAFLFCPHCGASFAERTPLKSHCNACDFTMYHSPKQGVVVVFVDNQGRLGLSRRAIDPRKGKIDPVGGFVEQNETLEESGVREAEEEVRIQLSVDRLEYFGSAFHDYQFKEMAYKVIDSYFMVHVTEEEKALIVPQSEVASFDWYAIKSIDPDDYFYRAGYDLLLKTFS